MDMITEMFRGKLSSTVYVLMEIITKMFQGI